MRILAIMVTFFVLGPSVSLHAIEDRHRTVAVLLDELPSRINPADASLNYAYYILRQLNEPLFFYKSVNEFESRILSKWKADPQFEKFDFCIKEGVSFSNGKQLNANILISNIRRIYKAGIRYLQESGGQCIHLEFLKPNPGIFNELSKLENSIIDPESENQKIVYGISDFIVEEISPSVISLSRRQNKSEDNIHRLIFQKWSHGQSGLSSSIFAVDDFNHIPQEFLPFWAKNFYTEYKSPILQTVMVVINHRDSHLRSILQNCLQYGEIRRLFVPLQGEFNNIGSLTPIGISGSSAHPIIQRCDAERSVWKNYQSKRQLTFISYKPQAVQPLQAYMDNALQRTGVNVKVVYMPISEMVASMLSKSKRYDLAIVAFDAAYPDPMSFFDYFFVPDKKVVLEKNKVLSDLFEKYAVERSYRKRVGILEQANTYLIESAQIIPLYQEARTFYLPRRLKIEPDDPLFMSYIRFSEVKIRRSDSL